MSKPVTGDMNLRMAWAHLILGMDQHDVAALFSVNAGRVAEAVKAARLAMHEPLWVLAADRDRNAAEDAVLDQVHREMDQEKWERLDKTVNPPPRAVRLVASPFN